MSEHSEYAHNPVRPNIQVACPSADVIVDYVTNDLSMKVRRRVDEHYPNCDRCKFKIETLRAVLETHFGSSPEGTPGASSPKSTPSTDAG
jgi:hypothetical protein